MMEAASPPQLAYQRPVVTTYSLVRMQPFGRAVVPEVYSSAASLSLPEVTQEQRRTSRAESQAHARSRSSPTPQAGDGFLISAFSNSF